MNYVIYIFHQDQEITLLSMFSMASLHDVPHFSTAEVPKEPRPLGEVAGIVPFERPPVIERLQANVAKRKSTTPQKFVGEYLFSGE